MKFTDTYIFRCANNPYIRYPKPWDTYFTLPFSVPISELLCKTRIKPNTVSVISLLVALVAAGFFYVGEYTALALGAIAFYVSYILDCADGYIARKKNLTSSFGHWIDHTFDEIKKPILLIAILLGQSSSHPLPAWAWVGTILYIFSRVLVKTDSTVKGSIQTKGRTDVKATGESQMMLAPRQRWMFENLGIVVLFTSIEAQSLAFIVGPLLKLPLQFIFLAGVLSIIWFAYVDGIRFWQRFIHEQKSNTSHYH